MTTSAFLHSFSMPSKPESEFIKIVRGEGSILWDDKGNRYIDGLASLWYCQVGHARADLLDAMRAQMDQLESFHTFDPFTNEPAAEVSDLIASKSPHPDGRVFLGCSGSEAVDSALKIARLVQQRRHGGTVAEPADRQIIVRRTRGYHGTNFGGTTAQGLHLNREGFGDLVPHFVEIPGDDIEAAASVFAEHGDRIAALITEPIQGAGGVHPPVEGYLEGLRRLCDQNGSLLIFDEVICGFGRTGSWFGSQTFGVTPDMMTFAKGVSSGYQPLSGVIVSKAIADELEDPGFLLRHGYTYSGHPMASAAGIANINVIEHEGLVDRANRIGERITQAAAAMQSDGLINGYRGAGALWALTIDGDAAALKNDLIGDGLVLRGVDDWLALCPPLVITDAELDEMLDKIQLRLQKL